MAPGRRPSAEVWAIAWPTVVTMSSYTMIQFVDSLMVAQVGPIQVAAQGNGGIWAFTPIAFAMGVLSVVNTFVSQNLGAKRPERCSQYAWASVWMSVLIWAIVLVPWALALPWFFERLGHSEQLQALETVYGRVLLLGGIVLLISRGLNHFFFGLHRPIIVTISAIAGNVVNVLANYVLIFGENGLPALGLPGVPGVPALGLVGAAIGTVIGTTVELIIPATIFLGRRLNAEFNTRHAWRLRWKPIKDLARIGWPGAVQFGSEITCWAIFMSALVGHYGEAHMAAGWATLRFMHLSFFPTIGFSVAATSLVGRYIGAGEPNIAANRARLAVVLSLGWVALCALCFVLFRHELIGLFVNIHVADVSEAEEIVRIGGMFMIAAAVFQLLDAIGIVYTGALRGAGDTVWPGVMTILLSWSLIVGGGAMMMRIAPGLESLGPWIASAAYIIIYGIVMALRFESGRWRSIDLLAIEKEPSLDRPPRQADQGSTLDRDAMEVAPLTPGPPTTGRPARGTGERARSQ